MTHTELVAALAKDGATIAREMTGPDAHLVHMSMGISGEIGEIVHHLDAYPCMFVSEVDELIEECGDLEFYMEGYQQGLDHLSCGFVDHGYIVSHNSVMDIALGLVFASANIIEHTKKFVVYRKTLNVLCLWNELNSLHGNLAALYNRIGTSRVQVLDLNIKKLTKRYGAAYSDAAAIARVDVQQESVCKIIDPKLLTQNE
jgi:hypothetical protein